MTSSGTLKTVLDYILDIRVLLQDTVSPYRYDDDSLLASLNVTLIETRRLRPDLFIGLCEIPQYLVIDNTCVPIEAQFRLAVEYGVVGHALTRDEEDVQDARSSQMMQNFTQMLVGGGQAPPRVAGGSRGGNKKGSDE